MTKYNHAFDMAFAVPNSQYEDWYDCLTHEKELVIQALLRRVGMLVNDHNEFMEAFSGFDTYEEDDLDAGSTTE